MPDVIAYPAGGMSWPAIVTKVHDGDTVTLDIDLGKYVRGKDTTFGFHVYIQSNRLHIHNATRLFGINAAELVTPEGKSAQQALAGVMPVGTQVSVTTWLDQMDKYGRVLGRIWDVPPNAFDVNQWMIDNGHAAIYYGTGPKNVP